jgi:hypothetical protein
MVQEDIGNLFAQAGDHAPVTYCQAEVPEGTLPVKVPLLAQSCCLPVQL